MKTAREWFQCLRPDLRDRAIKLGEKHKNGNALNMKFTLFSDALAWSFYWNDAIWNDIYNEAVAIENGRKPDIKP